MSDLGAAAVVLAGLQRAPVHDLLASPALEAAGAEAFVGQVAVAAGGPVLTRVRVASVDAGLAIGSRVPVRTIAFVLVDEIFAGAAVHARGGGAILVVDLAVGTGEALGTLAGVGIHEIGASRPVLTRRAQTFVDVLLAFGAREAGGRNGDGENGEIKKKLI